MGISTNILFQKWKDYSSAHLWSLGFSLTFVLAVFINNLDILHIFEEWTFHWYIIYRHFVALKGQKVYHKNYYETKINQVKLNTDLWKTFINILFLNNIKGIHWNVLILILAPL